jgi:beta-galactosidase GanA
MTTLRKYGDIAELNAAWSAKFWSQRYDYFAEILPPPTRHTRQPHTTARLREVHEAMRR